MDSSLKKAVPPQQQTASYLSPFNSTCSSLGSVFLYDLGKSPGLMSLLLPWAREHFPME